MTVIAYRDGVMAADTSCADSVSKVSWAQKVLRGPDGALYGFAGRVSLCCEIARWVRGEREGERPPLKVDDGTAQVMVVRPDGSLSVWVEDGTEDYDGAEYMAIGSGAGVALGAMHAGATAEGAVRAAIEHAPHCGGSIRAVQL